VSFKEDELRKFDQNKNIAWKALRFFL